MSTNIQNPAIETLMNLTRIDPNLNIVDPQYTENLNGYLRALQSNIDQILSIPFLQGRQGDSVLIGEFPIFSDEYEYGFDNEPNRIGFELITKLFPLADWNAPTSYIPEHPCNDDLDIFIDYYLISRRDNPDTSDTWQDIIDSVPEYAPVHDVCAWENLCPNGDYSMKVQLYYTVDYNTNDKKILGSSRYFVYYDPRLAQISGGLDSNEVFRDVSAALFRESYEENNETLWHFVNKGILPTIYWSAENGYWCWSINEIDTGIRCEGIKGEDGKDGNARVVRVSTDSTTSENSGDFRGMKTCIINSVFDQTSGWISNDLGTLLEDNMVVFAIIDDVLPENSEDPENEDTENEEPTLSPNLAFGVVFREAGDSTWKCYAYINTSLATLVRNVTLTGLLDTINEAPDSLKGLCVKDYSAYSDSSDICHALYSDTSYTLKIAPVNWSDFTGGDIVLPGINSTLSLNYGTLSIPSSMTLTNSSNSSLTTINCSNLKIASGSQALTINGTSSKLGSESPYPSFISISEDDMLIRSSDIDVIGTTTITGNTTINGKTEITRNSTWGESLTLNNTTTLFNTLDSGQIRGTFVINNTINVNTGIGSVDKIYALKINNIGGQKLGIHCTGQCDIIGITNIKNSDSNTKGQVSINATGVTLIGDTTTIENKPASPDGKVTINSNGINLKGNTTISTSTNVQLSINNNGIELSPGQRSIRLNGITVIEGITTIGSILEIYGNTFIKNTLYLDFGNTTYKVIRENDGTLKAIQENP